MPRSFSPGLYEALITRDLARVLEELKRERRITEQESLDPADSHVPLTRHVAGALSRALDSFPKEERLERQLELVNEILELLAKRFRGSEIDDADDLVDPPPRELRALAPPSPTPATQIPPRPTIPLSEMDLIVNARGEPRIGNALECEIPSADSIDLLCAFVRWNGIRILEGPLRRHLAESRRRLRVITTVYTGSTERRALDFLHALGAEVRVSYDVKTTRLHAKAWLFHRDSGFSTAYVGSSNLSRSALLDGVEWNVRLSEVASPELLTKFRGTFESYWNDLEYEPYDPARDAERFDRAIAPVVDSGPDQQLPSIDIHPYTHQQEILEKLDAERERHGHFRNVVVAATGTGKTIVAALDYKRQSADGPRPSLLFVAHRKEILTQSRSMFRMVLRDGSFGELYVDGHRPDEWKHVFASVQSLQSILKDNPGELDPTAFDVVIVDEFHHAEAPTYRRLLEHVKPKILLGLTATPERADGQSVLEWFDGRIAAELRLWDALERQILSPFQYFGLHDETDLSNLTWKRRGYDTRELENLYTGNHARVRLVVQAMRDKIASPAKIRALGFCVSVAHAEFMAHELNRLGIPALAVSGESRPDERDNALRALRERQVAVLFSVDLYNEGVDVPEIDTVLFLRPTESATVFLQQLGRGLRLVEGKDCLTVLDFIGNAHRNFRFERRFRALTGAAHGELRRQIDDGFPYLPAGCSIQLDRVAKEIVLENLQRALGGRFQSLVDELRPLGADTTLARFLEETGLDVEDLYRSNDWSWTRLRRAAGFPTPPEAPQEKELLRGVRRAIYHNDPERLRLFGETLSRPTSPASGDPSYADARMLLGLYCTLSGTREPPEDLAAAMAHLWQHPAVLDELRQLFTILEDRDRHVTHPLDGEVRWPQSIPLSVHARYQVADVFTAFGPAVAKRLKGFREGVFFDEATGSDLFFVTLEKAEKHYSPTTRYRDYAISPDLFHWDSQSTTTVASPTGQRYIRQRENGTNVFLFVRRTRRDEDGRTAPYTFLGPADHVSHERERPIQIIWKLRRPMPADFFREAKVAAG
ncbi:MAG: DUF3427 domain-containing protein [Candidatus Binatia bacterium]